MLAGGSGVQSLLSFGPVIQDHLDGGKSFAAISWDPRGVGHSAHFECFNNTLQNELWSYQQRLLANLDSSDVAMHLKLANLQGRAKVCAAQRYNNSDDRLQTYMTTASTARDMLEIFKLDNDFPQGFDSASKTTLPMSNNQVTIGSNTENVRLNYLGASYGTFLGNTFASLYPQYVGKMALDGNVDADNWASKWWTTSILDFEAVWEVFYDRCFLAKNRCALWRSSDSSRHDIETRTQTALEDIKARPKPIFANDLPDVVTYSDITRFVFESFYSIFKFPALASVLNAVYTRNFSHQVSLPGRAFSCSQNTSLFFDKEDSNAATICGDADPSLTATNMSEFQEYLHLLRAQSSTAGPKIAAGRLNCMAQSSEMLARNRFAGPFGTAYGALQTPILFFNNRLDPVCPIANARKMAMQYPGSVVLEQDAVGHCALAASLGNCVVLHLRKYFNEGVLPPNNTICPGGCQAFEENCIRPRMHEFYIL